MHLRNWLAACAAGCSVALVPISGASAADIYTAPRVTAETYVPYQGFGGFYIGGHVGGAWASLNSSSHNFFFNDGEWGTTAVPYASRDFGTSAVFGGVQFGYNFQGGPWVYGIEVDTGGIGEVNNNNHNLVVVDPVNTGNLVTLRANGGAGWYGDVTGRLGYSWGPAMVYAKGGFAWFDPNLSVRETIWSNGVLVSGAFNNNNSNNTLTGWTVGAGLEYQIGTNWSFKVEYLHFDFSNDNNGCCFDGIGNWRFFDRDLTVDTVKVGFNYFFHPAPQPQPLK